MHLDHLQMYIVFLFHFHHRFHHFLCKWKVFFPLHFVLQHITVGSCFYHLWEKKLNQFCNESPVLSRSVWLSGYIFQWGFVCLFVVLFFHPFPIQGLETCKLYCLSGLRNQWSWSGELALQAKLFSPHNTICFLLVKHGKSRVIIINMLAC